MNYLNPIYTEKANCQDCYKCVRNCPVKAIKVDAGSATVIYEACILCGGCVEVCPVNAKKVRNDLNKVKQLFSFKEKVIASLAPSFISEFPGIKTGQIISALKSLGFYGVSETALGAQEVSANVAELLHNSTNQLFISSACPTVVEYLKKYHPQVSDRVTDFLSPVLSQCKILKNYYGDEIGIVFIGPCISKKMEADNHPELLDAVLTFEEFKQWLTEKNIQLSNQPENAEENSFIPYVAQEGALYPIDGGMIAGIKNCSSVTDADFMSFSGLEAISRAMKDIDKLKLKNNLFIELLACEGGCVNGPKTAQPCSTVLKRSGVIEYAEYPVTSIPRKPSITIEKNYNISAITSKQYSEEQIREVLMQIGKHEKKDELNCAGCGYNSCREFALSLLDQKSETTMCVTYMRQLAQKKANALIKTMPSGIVIVDDKLKVVECNENWAELMGEDTQVLYEVKPGLEGAYLQKIVPFYKLFQNVLESGEEIIGKEISFNNSVLLFSIFTIEKNRFVGGIFRDITEPSVRKEQIINKAKQVIRKNLSTVQKIAYLLGENASESEVILNSIIDSYSTDKINNIEE